MVTYTHSVFTCNIFDIPALMLHVNKASYFLLINLLNKQDDISTEDTDKISTLIDSTKGIS